MKWLCSVGVAVSLALQPALADDLFGNHPLTPQARDAFVTELLKKMTVDEKIGQLRLISVGPDNPKEAIREMIKDGQVGAIFNTVTRQDIRAMQDQVMQLSRLKIPCFSPMTWCTASAPSSRLASVWPLPLTSMR
jgi:beta-glucosidase